MSEIRLAYVSAPKDVNGNPRRGWLMWQDHVCRWVDEGYNGNGNMIQALGFDVADSESYRIGTDVLYNTPGFRLEITASAYRMLQNGDYWSSGIADILESGRGMRAGMAMS